MAPAAPPSTGARRASGPWACLTIHATCSWPRTLISERSVRTGGLHPHHAWCSRDGMEPEEGSQSGWVIGFFSSAYSYRRFQAEGQQCLCRNHNLPVACECRACRACASTGKAADQRSFTASRQPADQRSKTSAAADESGRALAFPFLHAFNRAGGNRIGVAVGANSVQTNGEFGCALEAP